MSSDTSPKARPPLVSVGIVDWNDGDHLPDCLDSVFAQTWPAIEVLISDNGSSDGSPEAAQEAHPEIRVVHNGENIGFGPAHNRAIAAARGEYYLALNPDVVLEPDYIENMVRALMANPGYGYANGLVYFRSDDPRMQNVVCSAGHLFSRACQAYNRLFVAQVAPEEFREGEIGGANGACPLYSRAMIDDISVEGEFFDETYFLYSEDVDVDWRAHLAGWRCRFVPSAVAHHIMEATGAARRPEIRAQIAVNRHLMILKNFDWSLLAWHLPGIVKCDFAEILPVLSADWRSLKYIFPGLIAKIARTLRRRRIQRERRRWGPRRIREWARQSIQIRVGDFPRYEGNRIERRDGRLVRTPPPSGRPEKTPAWRQALRAIPFALWVAPRQFATALWGWLGPDPNAGAIGDGWDLLTVSHVQWEHVWQRNQHVMSRMARERKVLYCYPVKGAMLKQHWRNAWRPVRRDPSGVLLLHYLVVPGSRLSPLIDRLNAWLLAGCMRALMRRMGMRPAPVLWFYFPDQLGVVGRLGERAVVCDIQDDYTQFEWASPVVAEREQALLRRADQTFTGTDALHRKHEAASRRIRFLPCGVDFEFFHAVRSTPPPVPPEIADLQGPVLGYFGLVDHRIDLELIAELARRRPDWTFLMIGPRGGPETDDPAFTDNVRFTGPVLYSDLPAYSQTFDVCLMPFVLNELTRAINPTKTLEYFALERPVVSSRIPDVETFYGEVVLLADGADQWHDAIERALAGEPKRVAKALEIARERSWEAMTHEFTETIEDMLREKRAARE